MQPLLELLERMNRFLWGLPVLLLLGAAHLTFTIRLKFPQKYTFHAIRLSVTPESGRKEDGLSGFAALATTLAATLGTGNIIGVSTAIAVGGPGALFWCWITGILGMATCYAECYLSVLFSCRRNGSPAGGPMYVLEKGLHSRPLGMVYAACALAASFGVGCTTQSSAITEAVNTLVPVSPHLTGILAAVAAGLVILGGIRSIGAFCTRMVPALGLFYIACCTLLLFQNWDALPAACSLILKSAFTTRAAAGGFIGSSFLTAARYGIARGLFTNEAGIGTAAIAAGSSHSADPRRQGMISMTAVFWDTVVMCAVTGLVIISNILKHPSSIQGYSQSSLTTAAFTFLPFGGSAILSLSLVAFALTTLIGWCYYGEKASEYLFGPGSLVSYHLCYIVMIYIGAVLPMELVWSLTDLINALMVFPSCLALFALCRKVKI